MRLKDLNRDQILRKGKAITPNAIIRESGIVRILLNGGAEAVVDESDYEQVREFHWYRYISKKKRKIHYAYCVIRLNGGKRTSLKMHRIIMDAADGEQVDHRDGDGLNNRRSNLRVCTHGENLANSFRSRGASRYVGVTRNRDGKRWRATVNKDGVKLYDEWFDTEELAARARDAAAVKIYGEFATLNFPREVSQCG